MESPKVQKVSHWLSKIYFTPPTSQSTDHVLEKIAPKLRYFAFGYAIQFQQQPRSNRRITVGNLHSGILVDPYYIYMFM